MNVAHCEELVKRVSAGDRQAGKELVAYLWPIWIEYVRTSRSMGPLAKSPDHVHNVVARLVAKLSDPASNHLAQYLNWRLQQPAKTFDDWTRIVVKNQVRDYAREMIGARVNSEDEPSAKRLLNEFTVAGAPESGTRPPFTAAETARELVEFARSRLPADQLTALGLWLEGSSYEDIEQRLSSAAGQGKRLVRAAVAMLRRHFGAEESEDDLA